VPAEVAERLWGLHEVAAYYGISRQLALKWAARSDFPEPLAELAQGAACGTRTRCAPGGVDTAGGRAQVQANRREARDESHAGRPTDAPRSWMSDAEQRAARRAREQMARRAREKLVEAGELRAESEDLRNQAAKIEEAWLPRALEAGVKPTEIGRLLGISQQAVSSIITRRGLRRRGQ